MEKLTDNWLTEGLIDFEYKKYVLMAYLQHARKKFNETRLYPCYSDLFVHYQNLVKLRENKEVLYGNFPEKISRADFKRLKLNYEKIVKDDDLMKQIEDIIFFALPRFKEMLDTGREMYEFIDQNLELQPVGISPLNPDEGYIFLAAYHEQELRIFRYQTSIFESSGEKYRGINTEFLESVRKSVGTTYEYLKLQLIKRYRYLPNPAAFVVHAKVPCPFNETFLPIARRKLMRHIARTAA